MDYPTPEIERRICGYIRGGSFPDVAAEAAGVPRDTFRRWLAEGEQALAPIALRFFADEVRKATAEARVLAETEVKKNPLAWLKHGPGRESADMPGWTQPARAKTSREARAAEALAQEEVAQLCADLLRALADFPEARAAAAAALKGAADSNGE